MRLRTIDSVEDAVVDLIVELLDSQRARLGHVPAARVHERAASGLILVAERDRGGLAGAAVFDLPFDRVRLDYLVVAEEDRGSGIARSLVDRLASDYHAREEIRLTCRRDYPAHEMWPRLGFLPHGEVPAKSAGRRKTVWRRPLSPRPTLFDFHPEATDAEQHVAALDVNVALDLVLRRNLDLSGVLEESWLSDLVSYVFTDELLRELDRSDDLQARRDGPSRVRDRFEHVSAPGPFADEIQASLSGLMGSHPSPRDRSDVRQVAEAEAAGADFFVTRDDRLQRKYAESMARVRVVQPAELAMAVEGLAGQLDYSPAKLSETELQRGPLGPNDIRTASHDLVNHAVGERRTDFARKLRSLLSDRKEASSVCLWEQGRPIALAVLHKGRQTDTVSVLRVKSSHPLAATVGRELLGQLRSGRIRGGGGVVTIEDEAVSTGLEAALREEGFVPSEGSWVCRVLAGARSVEDWRERIPDVLPPEHALAVEGALDRVTDATAAWEVERLLWPAKILHAGVVTLLIPIKPAYAADLFDPALASQTLFDRPTRVALARENVYFRSPTSVKDAPFRALWYVSTDRQRRRGDQSVRALSRVEQVEVRPPNQLHRRFGKVGVLDQDRLASMAKPIRGERVAMAMRFGLTEQLAQPVPLKSLSAAAERFGHTLVLQWPNVVPEQLFAAIYREGSRA